MHEGMRNLNAWLVRYLVQTYGYILLLTGRYPSLAGAPTGLAHSRRARSDPASPEFERACRRHLRSARVRGRATPIVLIVNPFATGVTRERARRGRGGAAGGAEVVTRQTEARGHAQELAAEAADSADAVVVFSGDGTYNEAINGAAGTVPFGFVPGGGASVFPRALGLPRDPAAAAAQIADALAQDRTISVGLGRVNGRRFCFAAGIGLDAEVVRSVDARGRTADGRRPGNVVVRRDGRRACSRASGCASSRSSRSSATAAPRSCSQAADGRTPTPAAVALAAVGRRRRASTSSRRCASRRPRCRGSRFRLFRGTLAHDGAVLAGARAGRLRGALRPAAAAPGRRRGPRRRDEARFEAEPDALTVLV